MKSHHVFRITGEAQHAAGVSSKRAKRRGLPSVRVIGAMPARIHRYFKAKPWGHAFRRWLRVMHPDIIGAN